MTTRTPAGLRLTWSQVREHFSGEWVELVEYRWEWNRPHPAWAIIRHHAPDRNELIEMIQDASRSGAPDSTLLFVGHIAPVLHASGMKAVL